MHLGCGIVGQVKILDLGDALHIFQQDVYKRQGGYSALVSKGMTKADELLIKSIPQAMLETDLVCLSLIHI